MKTLSLIAAAILLTSAEPAFADSFFVDEPCFAVTVQIEGAHVLQVRGIRDDQFVIDVDRGDYPTAVTATFCGVGDWIIESRTASECVEVVDDTRRATGRPCVWRDWLETVTATVSPSAKPNPPFMVTLGPIRDRLDIE